jgi:hypothetical protein
MSTPLLQTKLWQSKSGISQTTKRGILNISLPVHGRDTIYTCSAALKAAQQEIVRLRRVVEESRQAVKEKEGVIERLRGELIQKGEMGGKLGGGSGWTGQRVEKVKRADKMMELLVKMDAREKGAYDPL